MTPTRAASRTGSGPAVARAFHAAIAAIFLIAWLSLGAQIDLLAGSRGLLPVAPFLETLRTADVPFHDAPTILRWASGDGSLHAGIGFGVVLALLALAGVAPRLCFALSTALYLGYAVACRTFLSFQWDNLLLECGFVAVLLPRDRRAWWAHLIARVVLFKLYWESGVAKFQSPLHDWHDGSAMTFYYETAPIPARLGWYAHALPAAWHHFEAWFTLFFELGLPVCIFLPRRPRLFAAAIFSGFQVVNVATANYGFFAYLALALHLFLLDERDVIAARARLERRWPKLRRARVWRRWLAIRIDRALARVRVRALPREARWAAALALVTAYVGASVVEALIHFGGSPELTAELAPIDQTFAPFRLVNTYHLFAAITRDRIEPELQTFDGTDWKGHDLHYKPGDVMRAPVTVAPHQPRVDFQLWFYGLSFRRGTPAWVSALLEKTCHDPRAIQELFPEPLPARPRAARMAFFAYHFTTPEERDATGAWWKREAMGATRAVECGP